MALIDLWKTNREELSHKHVQQIISIAGEGRLLDGNSTSAELRELLSNVPSSQLNLYARQCLDDKFDGSGFVLQDIMNQVAVRLGFQVELGRYRGQRGLYGHDGLWTLTNGHTIVVEVKTTDAYAINLDTVAAYRKNLVSNTPTEGQTSLLLIVGRHDTGGLEAQIRGSRYAWDMRIISVEGLLRLLELKETMEDPSIAARVSNILIPQEYTKLDEIIDIVFMTAEEVVSAETAEEDENGLEKVETEETALAIREPKFRPSSFHEKCASRLESHLDVSLIKQSRSIYATSDGNMRVWIAVSKQHGSKQKEVYWFGFHPHQRTALKSAAQALVVLGCASADILFIIPYADLEKYIDKMWVTERAERMYWHVKVEGRKGEYYLLLKSGATNPCISKFLATRRN